MHSTLLQDKPVVEKYLASFLRFVEDYTLPLLSACILAASKEEDPVNYIRANAKIIRGFMLTTFPTHLALSLPQVVPIR